MEERKALVAFAALSQETRLRIVRQLVTAGPDGLSAGTIGKEMEATSSRMSFHLSHLESAGLAESRREGRSIIYSATYSALSALVQFLMRDCCQGHPEVCNPAIAAFPCCEADMDVVIYHNPECGTSRNTLGLIRNSGIEPHVVEYLQTPPARSMLVNLVARMGIAPRDLLREKGTPYADLGLADPSLSDDALLDAMVEHPILINRPIVVTLVGARLCRPSETVLDLLPPQRGEFFKADGEPVVDENGQRVTTA